MITNKLQRQKHVRGDGWLVELISSKYEDNPFFNIHSYLVVIKPKCYRAIHYHKVKKEWLALANGDVKVILENILDKKREEIILSEDSQDYTLILIPPMTAHAVQNIGETSASVIVFSEKTENLDDTINYSMELEDYE